MRPRRLALAVFCPLLGLTLATNIRSATAAEVEAKAKLPAATGTIQQPLSTYARAETAPAETTLFLFNKILLTAKGFERKGATYETDYSARVSPFKSLSENGRLTIDVTDDQLRRLERGETVAFTGHAESKGGDHHTVSGSAIPKDKTSGTLKVQIVAAIVTLKFETTYRFTNNAVSIDSARSDSAGRAAPTPAAPSPIAPSAH